MIKEINFRIVRDVPCFFGQGNIAEIRIDTFEDGSFSQSMAFEKQAKFQTEKIKEYICQKLDEVIEKEKNVDFLKKL